MVHMRVRLHCHELIHVYTANGGDAAQVIAFHIQQHYMLGPLLGMFNQLLYRTHRMPYRRHAAGCLQ